MPDPRQPVIVGTGQAGADTPGWLEPLDLMDHALTLAAADCGAAHLLDRVDLVAVVRSGTVHYSNAAGTLARRRKFDRVRTIEAGYGGHMAQVLVAEVCAMIAAGQCEVAVIAGAETGSLLRRGEQVVPAFDLSEPSDLAIGEDIGAWMSHPFEAGLGLTMPIQLYPLIETARAWRAGESLHEHMAGVASLWSRFSQVAAENPHAIDRRCHPASEVLSTHGGNRYVGYPYTKLMNSNQFVDQGAALILCSSGAADAAGIARDRRIYPLAAAQADNGYVSHRASLGDAPPLARAAAAVEERTGLQLAEAPVADLYACFPSAVGIQAEALGLATEATPTVTGGMRFAGGPSNSYGLHMVANLVTRLRDTDLPWGVSCGNGGAATRFCLMAYGGRPPEQPFSLVPGTFTRTIDETCLLDDRPQGTAMMEAFSVMHDRTNQPVEAFVACRTGAGARAWAHLHEPAALEALMAMDKPGARIHFSAGYAELVA